MSTISLSDARRALEGVLASRSFARAEQLRRLLAYIATATMEGRENTLKETVIGVDVLNLPASFNDDVGKHFHWMNTPLVIAQ